MFAAGGVKIGPLAGTRMACVPDLGTQETRYLEALQNAERLALEGNALLVYSRGLDKPLRYGRAAP